MISVIGTGRVGIGVAIQTAMLELDDITLVDIVQGLPQGEALDLSHMCTTLNIDISIKASNDMKDISGSDIVVTTAGFIRKADMTRLDLLNKNAGVVKSVSESVAKYAPNSKFIIVTNPLDVMTYVAYKTTGFARSQIMGFSGPLDVGRFRTLLAQELNVAPSSISAMVIGEHGDSMVLLPRFSTVGGEPLTTALPPAKLQEIIEKTRKTGAEIIKLKGWSASHAPGAGVATMIDAIVRDRKAIIPTSVILNGEYSVSDVAAVAPAVLGAKGVEKIIELPLSDDEKAAFLKSVDALKSARTQMTA